MRSNDDMDFTDARRRKRSFFSEASDTSPNDYDGVLQRSQYPPGIPVMLFGEYLVGAMMAA
jgi:hypothetical protein